MSMLVDLLCRRKHLPSGLKFAVKFRAVSEKMALGNIFPHSLTL